MSSDKPCQPKIPPPCQRKCNVQAEEAEEEDKKEEPVKCVEMWHPGFDARFSNQNQTRRCWANYIDYIRCTNKFGEDHEPCEYFKKAYQYLCPSVWYNAWDEQRENGTFPMPPWV
ncbi:unnamed protein product [Candidula unifasciata]|uniref:Cytochrome c oxidase subunit n=1 Tax=Candidula unifasciata TaxID=100452 RepID=A0A8S3YQ95_9EUPU|nr:unnamed protein product [Candidula unifasciata]